MKTSIIITVFFSFFTLFSYAQVARKSADKPDANKKLLVLEASCGECNFGLDGDACDLAVKIDGKAYFVDGAADIQSFGHPHNKNGFCVAVRKAEVQGEVVDGRFKASYFNLLKSDEEIKK